jgi:transposase
MTEVYIAIQSWRIHGPTASLARAKEVQQYQSYSPKQALWLLFKAKRTVGEQQFVQGLLEQSAVIARTYESVRRFRQILTQRDETALPVWAYEAEESQIPELVRFVQRLRLDWEAKDQCITVCFQPRTGRRSGESAEGLQTARLWALQSCPFTGSVGGSK